MALETAYVCNKTSRATKLDQAYATGSVLCDGAAKPELIDSCTVHSHAQFLGRPLSCNLKGRVALTSDSRLLSSSVTKAEFWVLNTLVLVYR